ncbi:hypothetical protein AOLI_G00247220 [Acnodon oligacanthus]
MLRSFEVLTIVHCRRVRFAAVSSYKYTLFLQAIHTAPALRQGFGFYAADQWITEELKAMLGGGWQSNASSPSKALPTCTPYIRYQRKGGHESQTEDEKHEGHTTASAGYLHDYLLRVAAR